MSEGSGAVEAVLPSGLTVQVRVADEAGGIGSVGRSGPVDLRAALEPISDVAELVRERLESLTATRATVQFGVSFAAKSGKLTALVFEGSGEASLTVTLEWERTPGTAE
ncbi:MAG TPA: CU044_2847 family protein [Thermoleophilaceae bacterium]|jgi:hypothetical protein